MCIKRRNYELDRGQTSSTQNLVLGPTSADGSCVDHHTRQAGPDVVVSRHVDGVVVPAGQVQEPKGVGHGVAVDLAPLPVLATVVDGVAEDGLPPRPAAQPDHLDARAGHVAYQNLGGGRGH